MGDLATVLSLALGLDLPSGAVRWDQAFALARQERLAPLAWMRNGGLIRAAAPFAVAARWRAEAMSAVDLAAFWERLTASTVGALHAENVQPIVLKGLPLAERLYGDRAARPCADLDLFIPLEQREAAHAALIAAGWRWRIGRAPREGGYAMEMADRTALLEVHSALLDDALVSHLPFRAPEGRALRVGGVDVLAHDDAQLLAFLATHLAKHAMPPLLWWVDIATLWGSSGEAERAAALGAARAVRAERYLNWALRGTDAIAAAARGSREAAARLGFRGERREDSHNAIRVLTLAASWRDRAHICAGWLLPPDARGSVRDARAFWKWRLRKPIGVLRGTRRVRSEGAESRHTSASGAATTVRLGSDEFLLALRELRETGMPFTLRATGTSMLPSILPDAVLRMHATGGGRAVARGDVVLARLPAGGHLLHRVIRIRGDSVLTQGDANTDPDAPVPLRDVLAVANAIATKDGWQRIPSPAALAARRAVRRLLRLGPPPLPRRDSPPGRPAGAR